jgi:DNA-binding PadR family transcriptional regulator
MSKYPADFLHGTLETLILKTLTGGPRHGYAIGKWIEDATGSAIELEEGTLYPACSTPSGAPRSWAAARSSTG